MAIDPPDGTARRRSRVQQASRHCCRTGSKLCPNDHLVTIALPGVIRELLSEFVQQDVDSPVTAGRYAWLRWPAGAPHPAYCFLVKKRSAPMDRLASSSTTPARPCSLTPPL